jgi:5-methylcytosine-specific restriction endonuclease McrA
MGEYKGSAEFMNWYHGMDDAERKAYNRKRYERDRARRELLGTQRKKEKDPDLSMCNALYKRAADIPNCLVDLTTRPKTLAVWYKEHKGGVCKYCGGIANSIDHIIPISRGGKHSLANIQLICWHCNRAKNSFLPDEWDEWRKNISLAYTDPGNDCSKVVV